MLDFPMLQICSFAQFFLCSVRQRIFVTETHFPVWGMVTKIKNCLLLNKIYTYLWLISESFIRVIHETRALAWRCEVDPETEWKGHFCKYTLNICHWFQQSLLNGSACRFCFAVKGCSCQHLIGRTSQQLN